MKISDLDKLIKGDIIILSRGASYDPQLIGHNDGDMFEYISHYDRQGFDTAINLKAIKEVGRFKRDHIHRFSTSIVKYMECKRLTRENKLNDLGIC